MQIFKRNNFTVSLEENMRSTVPPKNYYEQPKLIFTIVENDWKDCLKSYILENSVIQQHLGFQNKWRRFRKEVQIFKADSSPILTLTL